MKNKRTVKIISLAAAVALGITTVKVTSCAGNATTLNEADTCDEQVKAAATVTDAYELSYDEEIIKGIVENKSIAGKEETVYVLADTDGTANEVIVSEWLKNPEHTYDLRDVSELENIENVKGYESYTKDSDNVIVWNAEGNDIYYQGTTNKKPPVDIAISYKLDGKPVLADELIGKSGKVTIRFDYKNNEYEEVLIDGQREKIYVPFVMITGMVVDDSFSNITVSNGKIVNDGDKSVVVAFAVPGLQESLDLDDTKLQLPDYVEITADVKNFSLDATATFATNEIFNSLNLDNVDTLEDIEKSLDTLSESSFALVDGSQALYEGLELLLEKSKILSTGANDLYTGTGSISAGMSQINTGTAQLSVGVSELDAGITELNSGLATLSSNSDALRENAKLVFDSLLQMANEQLTVAGISVPTLTIENYDEILYGVLGSLNKDDVYNMAYNTALSQVTEAVNAARPTIRAEVENAVRKEVLQGVLDSQGQGITVEEYEAGVTSGTIDEATKTAIDNAVEQMMTQPDIQALVDSNTEAKIQSLISENMSSAEITTQINAAVAQAEAGAGSIQALITQLDSYKAFYNGVLEYTDGVDTAYEGSTKLSAGSTELNAGVQNLSVGVAALSTGTDTLYAGMETLKNGTDALVLGEDQLYSGSKTLSDGMSEFNEKGIQMLVDAASGDAETLMLRIKAIVDVSKNYQSFGGKSEDVTGAVKFIYRTDSIN